MRIIHYHPFGCCYPITAAADRFACNLLDFFGERGWQVDCVFAHDRSRSKSPRSFKERYPWVRSITPVPARWTACCNLGDLVLFHDKLRQSRALGKLFRAGGDLFVSSGAFTAPLAGLAPQGCLRVLCLSELLSAAPRGAELPSANAGDRELNHLSEPIRESLFRSRESFYTSLEMNLCRLFDHVLVTNDVDFETVQGCRVANIRNVGLHIPLSPGCQVPTGSQPCDLLLAAATQAQCDEATWFYRNVYVPYLYRRGVRMALAGDSGLKQHFPEMLVEIVAYKPLPEIPTKLVVWPALRSAGTPREVIECLAAGCALVVSSAGVRGLPDPAGAFASIDMHADPGQTAALILDLLASAERRGELQRRAIHYVQQRFNRATQRASLDGALAALVRVA